MMDYEAYAKTMEAELAELRRRNLPQQTGEQMEYIWDRDLLEAIRQAPKHPPKPPYRPAPMVEAPSIAPGP
jgi:hypothetical protein